MNGNKYRDRVKEKEQYELTITFNKREAMFLKTVLGKMNGNNNTNPLHGLYFLLDDMGIDNMKFDMDSIDLHSSGDKY